MAISGLKHPFKSLIFYVCKSNKVLIITVFPDQGGYSGSGGGGGYNDRYAYHNRQFVK